jgi:hypothetical protein
MAGNYNGLTRNPWPGTWSSGASHPIVLDSELRGSLRYISGASGSQLTDITGQRLEEGMLVYVKAGYTAGGYTRKSETYYQYRLLPGQSRNILTGATPNAEENWREFVVGGGGGTGATGGSTGSTGYTGYTGPTGPGITGPTGADGKSSPLGFIKSSDNQSGSGGPSYQRDLVTFYDDDGPKAIRKFLTYNDKVTGQLMFALQLATFSPNFTSTTTPGASLRWDEPCTGFRVEVDNPTDFTTQYISSVHSLETTAGFVGKLSDFIAGTKTPTPVGGGDWTQIFTTQLTIGVTGVIRPISDTITGGSAAANVRYNSFSGSESLFTSSSPISVTWQTPGLEINTNSLSGQTFLTTYTSTPYTLSVSGLSSSSNRVHSVSTSTGTITNTTGDGTFTFTTPIHKDNASTPRTVSTVTTFTRPASVTGASYTAVLIASSTVSASFTYPSFWLKTSGIPNPPSRSNIISGNGFASGVNLLGNEANTFGRSIENDTADSIAFWFGVKADVRPQPAKFESGGVVAGVDGQPDGPGFLSVVETDKGKTVDLKPDSPPAGYTSAVTYALYGIILQPGKTYVKIT